MTKRQETFRVFGKNMSHMRISSLQKRGQLKMLESIAVLIVFSFLVGLGINFYGKMQLQSLEAAKADFSRTDAIKISQMIVHLPELRCSLENTNQGSCIDLYQAQAWASMQLDCGQTVGGSDSSIATSLCSERLKQYFEQIGVGEIVLKRIYSSTDPTGQIFSQTTWVLYNYSQSPNSNAAPTFTQIPVIISDSASQYPRHDLGVLQVKVYQ